LFTEQYALPPCAADEPATHVYALQPRDHKESVGGTMELTLTLCFAANDQNLKPAFTKRQSTVASLGAV
jgi:hypothetical protein